MDCLAEHRSVARDRVGSAELPLAIILRLVTGPTDPMAALASLADRLPLLLGVGWVVLFPPLSREEGHEAITRTAYEGLRLSPDQQRALVRGVRAPDVSLFGLLTSALPSCQRRHALRAWSRTTSARGIREMREYLAVTHSRALALPEGQRRWMAFGGVLHCLQDSYSPAHVDRDGARIARMKHWGPLDALRRGRPGGRPRDEHGFPSDLRDRAWSDGTLTAEAHAAAAASRTYLLLAVRQSHPGGSGDAQRRAFATFLDDCVPE